MSPGKATPEQVLTAVQIELALIVKRLIACRNRICRDSATYPDDLVAACRVPAAREPLDGLIPRGGRTETRPRGTGPP